MQACSSGRTAKIHNVRVPEMGHSEMFITTGHAETFWLPYLWGLEPADYRDFVALCESAATSEKADKIPELVDAEAKFHEKKWLWAGGRTVAERLEEDMREFCRRKNLPAPSDIQGTVKRGVRLVWNDVSRATARRGSVATALSKAAMYPETAVLRAVKALVQVQR